MKKWTIEDSKELYNINGWGTSYFGVNDRGQVVEGRIGVAVDTDALEDALGSVEIGTPLRFQVAVREPEITAAMKRLVTDVPVVGVLAGHGERSISNIGDKGYFSFAESKTFRHALINQGFDVREVSIDGGGVPEDISILMIADPKEPFEKGEKVQQGNRSAGGL